MSNKIAETKAKIVVAALRWVKDVCRKHKDSCYGCPMAHQTRGEHVTRCPLAGMPMQFNMRLLETRVRRIEI